MKPIVMALSTDLPGPSDIVWELLTDWEHQGEWMLEASDFVVVSPNRTGVGVEAEATVRIGGISTRDRIRVDVWEPERHLGIVHLGWVGGRGDLHLTPLGDSTRVDWREELHTPLGPLGAVGMRIFRPLMVRTFRRDLAVLARLVLSRAQRR
ncbi:MAG: SRPBCC family protein [Actinomycetota bacterium]